jgi:membrane protein YqaA with SNARE-associated domain
MDAIAAYAGLFATSFLVGLLLLDRYPALVLLAVASAGNVLGSCLNYVLGRLLAHSTRVRRLVNPSHRQRAENWYRRYGKWSLLASWLPVIGDPLTIVAGALRESFTVFLALVTIAKVGRYFVLFALHQAWLG